MRAFVGQGAEAPALSELCGAIQVSSGPFPTDDSDRYLQRLHMLCDQEEGSV